MRRDASPGTGDTCHRPEGPPTAELESFSFPALEGAPVGSREGAAERAARIVARARAEAERIAAAAEVEGRERGLAAGLAETREQLEPAQSALAEAAAGVEAAWTDLAAALERRAAELAVALADKILCAALELEPERVCDVVAGALRRAPSRDRLVLAVHPDDRPLVESAVEEIARSLGGIGRLEVRAERRVERGGCVVATEEGEIDAQRSVQLARASEALLDAARGR